MAPTTSFCVVASETKRIINAHGRHFRGLFFCLLNFSFSLIIYKYPTAANLSLLPLALRLALSLFAILFSLFAFLFSLSAFSTVTYSTYHGFCGRPDKLAASFKLVSPTLLPLVSTTIATQVLMFLVCASFGLFLVVVTKGAEILGFEIDYNSNYYLGFCIAVFVILVLVLVYLQVNWVLASAIVVLESKWGFEALRRSVYLVKGMRSVSLSLMLLLGSVTGLFLWVHSRITSLSLRSYPDVWESLGFVLLNLVESGFVSLIMLYNVASNTVLYMYCKALHGELALKIPEEYVSLPLDDANLPRVEWQRKNDPLKQPLPASAKPAIASCRKKKSEEATFLEDLKDHVDEFIHASMDEHKTCFKKTIQKMFGMSKVVAERSADAKGVESSLPLQTTVAE